jgi:site-specific DNA recombinase
MKRVVAYLRVSTEGQTGEDKYGLPAQREHITAYAAQEGLEIAQWYSDEGISGAMVDRPGLQELLRDAENGEFDLVLVAKMDRIARDLFVQLWVEKELTKASVELISVTEPFTGNDPMNTAFRQMMGVFAELEKSMITWRMAGGRIQKAKRGGYAGGAAPIGYKAERGSKVLQLDPEKARTVARVFEIKEQNPALTLQQIADILNEEGHTTARGAEFKPMQVKRILDRREVYQGQYEYAGIRAEGKHKAII